MDLRPFLKNEGYSEIPLESNSLGHFQAPALLDGKKTVFIVDTGAAGTIIDKGFLEANGYQLSKIEMQGGGVGSVRMELFTFRIENFLLSGFGLKTESFMAMDLANVNETLAMKDASAVDGIIGADVLKKHGAVIDYVNNILYLR